MTAPTTAPPLPGLLYAQAAEYQDRLVALEDEAAAAMERAWETSRRAIQADLDTLMARVQQAGDSGERMSPSWAFREARYRQALATVDEQVALYAQTAARLAGAAQGRALELATTSAASLGSAAVAEAGVAATFVAVNPGNLQHLVGFLQDGTPLADLFATLGPNAVQGARDVLTHGIVLGRGTDRIARDLQRVTDVPRWRSVTIARTESHRVFREASRQTYAQNADVLEGWTWTAHLDSHTCPGCVAMHGTQHTVTDQLDGHPRCRCAMVPRIRSWADLTEDDSLPDTRPTIGRGTDWLRDQPTRVQRAVLGPGKFAAWRNGELDLEDLVHRSSDTRWGTMRRESTLAEAKAAARARVRGDQRQVQNTMRRRV